MKNLKRLLRNELRSLKGAGPVWSCTPNPCPKGSCCKPGRWPDIPTACYICADS